jgi:hypothetical protein
LSRRSKKARRDRRQRDREVLRETVAITGIPEGSHVYVQNIEQGTYRPLSTPRRVFPDGVE